MLEFTERRIFDILKQVQGSRKQAQQLDNAPVHPFPARMPLALAEFLVERFSDPGDTILDPMVGSGTTLAADRTVGGA
jgi:DNA modification methylase